MPVFGRRGRSGLVKGSTPQPRANIPGLAELFINHTLWVVLTRLLSDQKLHLGRRPQKPWGLKAPMRDLSGPCILLVFISSMEPQELVAMCVSLYLFCLSLSSPSYSFFTERFLGNIAT